MFEMNEKDMLIGDLISLGWSVKGGKQSMSCGDCLQTAWEDVLRSYPAV